MPDRRAPVAIVGGGFSGTMVAAHLARRGIRSVLIEANGKAGQGTAFSTSDPAHLLNIRADNMGAWANAPEDFAARENVAESSYAERRQFGRYLRAILDEAVASGNVEVVEDRAAGARRNSGGWIIDVARGQAIEADALVLALGNQPPGKLPLLEAAGDRVVDDPWGDRARAAIADTVARQDDVLIVGTSLTMIDVALSLHFAGHRGRILALSRRGKIPLGQEMERAPAFEPKELPHPKIRSIARWLRSNAKKVGWRAAVDSLRPHSHHLWQALPLSEKRLFLRFGRPWWDIHRHRIAPAVATKVEELLESGQLEVAAGQLVDVRDVGNCVDIRYRRRGHVEVEPARRFGYIFNCTGPLGDISRTRDPLLRQLLDSGDAKPDELFIGLAVDAQSRVSERLWALGTLTKGRYWEMIAVPDIRDQAAAVAEDIAMELGQ